MSTSEVTCTSPQPLAHSLPRDKVRGARYVREGCTVQVLANTAVKRGATERERTRLGGIKDECSECRYSMCASPIRADQLQVDGLCSVCAHSACVKQPPEVRIAWVLHRRGVQFFGWDKWPGFDVFAYVEQ